MLTKEDSEFIREALNKRTEAMVEECDRRFACRLNTIFGLVSIGEFIIQRTKKRFEHFIRFIGSEAEFVQRTKRVMHTQASTAKEIFDSFIPPSGNYNSTAVLARIFTKLAPQMPEEAWKVIKDIRASHIDQVIFWHSILRILDEKHYLIIITEPGGILLNQKEYLSHKLVLSSKQCPYKPAAQFLISAYHSKNTVLNDIVSRFNGDVRVMTDHMDGDLSLLTEKNGQMFQLMKEYVECVYALA